MITVRTTGLSSVYITRSIRGGIPGPVILRLASSKLIFLPIDSLVKSLVELLIKPSVGQKYLIDLLPTHVIGIKSFPF